jgi:hypothetical protein
MKLARVGVIAAAVLAVATLAWAQKPDFSGTWTLDPAASDQPGGGGGGAPGGGGGGGGRGGGRGGLGQGGTVKQTADTLTVERTIGENKITSTYKLDGSESKNTMMGRGGQSVESVSTAKFDGQTLVITTKMDMGNGPQESTQKWLVSGSTLTIETTNARGTQKMVYKK